eukprot:7583614-Alexandrium_andersonii.AAC.1
MQAAVVHSTSHLVHRASDVRVRPRLPSPSVRARGCVLATGQRRQAGAAERRQGVRVGPCGPSRRRLVRFSASAALGAF